MKGREAVKQPYMMMMISEIQVDGQELDTNQVIANRIGLLTVWFLSSIREKERFHRK